MVVMNCMSYFFLNMKHQLPLCLSYLLVGVFLITSAQALCQPCPSTCSCFQLPNSMCQVNCSGASLTVVPSSNDIPPQTSELLLQNNWIDNIGVGAFDNITSLAVLNLANNRLTTLPDDVFFLPLTSISLSGNKWICNCSTKRLQIWMENNDAIIINNSAVLCDFPATVRDMAVINVPLTNCVGSYISCNTSKDVFFIWEYSNSTSSATDTMSSCVSTCFSKGYYYSLLSSAATCYCSGQNSGRQNIQSGSAEWNSCLESCADSPPTVACYREVLKESVIRASPNLTFTGWTPYLQTEQVVIEVSGTTNIVADYMWNFNDTSSIQLTSALTVHHKFGASGRYWVTVTARNGVGMKSYSFLLVVEEALGGFNVDCPTRLISGTHSIPYTLKRGTNPKISWKIKSEQQATQPESVAEPSHYVSGSTLFSSESLTNPVDKEIFNRSVDYGAHKYVLLFPGIWFVDEAEIQSWEFVYSPRSNLDTIVKLQIYRPSCNTSLSFASPGCIVKGLPTPYATCTRDTCSPSVPDCGPGTQFCYFSQSAPHCRDLLTPCNMYKEYNVTTPLRHSDVMPMYTLVKEYPVQVGAPGLYRVVDPDNFAVQLDDIIGFGFENNDLANESSESIFDQIPLRCQNSIYSPWRQSAFLFAVNHSNVFDNLTHPNKWVDFVWCDIRVHYAKQVEGSTLFANDNEPGEETYIATVSNPVSNASAECTIRTISGDIEVSLIKPPPTEIDGLSIVYMPRNTPTNFSIKITGDVGVDIEANWTVTKDDIKLQDTKLESNCSDITSDVNCSKVFRSSLSIPETGNSTISISARNVLSSALRTVRIVTEEAITGTVISPPTNSRLLAGTYLELTTNSSTGTNITSDWVIDGLAQFAFTRSTYNVLFRTPSTYIVTASLANHVSTDTDTATFVVDEFNRLSNLQFVGDEIVERAINVQLQITVEIDEDMSAEVVWNIDNVETIHSIDPPYTSGTAIDSIEQVRVSDTLEKTFLSTGNKTLMITVRNDYDSINIEKIVSVRSKLVSLAIRPLSALLTGEYIQFELNVSPSGDGCSYTIDWDDGSAEATSQLTSVSYLYSSPRTYNVSLVANNFVSSISTSTLIQVYEKISGLTIDAGPPTELSLNTTISANLAFGLDSDERYFFDFGNGDTSNSTNRTILYKYATPGLYNLTVTAYNPESQETHTIEIQVFELEVKSVTISSVCFKTNADVQVHANMPVDRMDLFGFDWIFGDESDVSMKRGNNTNSHVFTQPGFYEGNVSAFSLLTEASAVKIFNICVQNPISSITFQTSTNAVKTGSTVTFNYTIFDGTDPNSTINFGDGNTTEFSGLQGRVDHIYSQAGNYTVVIRSSNFVSMKNESKLVIVQDEIANIVITTNTDYGTSVPQGREIYYTASYSGSTAHEIVWDFGGSSSGEHVYGSTVSHTYNGADDRTITLVVTNLVSSVTYEQKVNVYDPVNGVSIVPTEDIVPVGTAVWLNATTKGNAKIFFWKITPSNFNQWNYNSTLRYYQYTFTTSGAYNITLKAENEASAQYSSVEIVVADPLSSSINIIAYNKTVIGDFGAVGEPMWFEVTLPDGQPISSTVGGRTDFLTFEWRFINNSAVEGSVDNTSFVKYTFLQLGEYTIWVNVSNTVSTNIGEIKLTLVERISGVVFYKLDPPDKAVATGDEVRLNVTLQNGTDVEYTWKAHSSYSPVENKSPPSYFTYTYQEPGLYDIVVILENPLEAVSATFLLSVQDKIQGLEITHLDPVKPFYVSHYVDTCFHADVENGTNVEYVWRFVNLQNNVPTRPKSTDVNTYKWNFTEISSYLMIVNATNDVSWETVNTTVYVLNPVNGLQLSVPANIISTNESLQLSITLESGFEAQYSISFGDNTTLLDTIATSTAYTPSHTYTNEGTYEIVVHAFNNASITNATEIIVVRDVIVGLDILGCGHGQYINNAVTYNLSAYIQLGSAVTFEWSITFSDGQQQVHIGQLWSVVMPVVGSATIKLHASNEIHHISKNITVTIEEPPQALVRLANTGKIFVNETVEIEISPIAGTNVFYDVDFEDGNIIKNSSNFVHTNVYIDDGDYLITVLAFNNVGKNTSTIRVSIKELACVGPVLSFVGNAALQTRFYRSRKVYLETEIRMFGCTAYTVMYSWRVYKQDTCNNLSGPSVNLLTTTHTPLLSVPALTLDIGKYCVTNTATYLGTSLSDFISTTIEVVSSPLAVIIAGGTSRSISQSAVLVLDASSSFDPDLPAGSQTPLDYSWTCSSSLRNGLSGTTSSASDGCFATSASTSVRIPAADLSVDYAYNFTVTASKIGKSAVTTWQSVIIVPATIPTVSITCHSCHQQSRLKISSAYQLVLMGSCDNCNLGVTYSWEATGRRTLSGPPLPFLLNKVTTTTGNSGRYLVVRATALSSFYELTFKLTVTSIATNSLPGYSTLVLYANQPPANGSCTMTYDGSQVYVLETLVQFNCDGWEDEDISPLIYHIIAVRYNGGIREDDFIIYRGTSSNYEAYLPLGFEDNQFDLIIQVLVEDELGTYSVGLNETLNVKLRDKTSTIEWLRNKTSVELADLQKANNPQVVADFAAGLITVLNQDSQSHGSTSDDQEFESRKEIRNNITQSVTSLSTNTFDEIQQVTAVFKQCMKVPSEFQDTTLHNISLVKLNELTQQMPDFVDTASDASFLAVTSDLVGIVSYMVDSINYHVYVTGEANTANNQTDSTLSQDYRKQLVETLMASAVQLTDNVLEGKVEGEEPVFFNASAFSSLGARTTPANMNSSIQNDGCYFQLPDFLFSDLSQEDEIFYILFVSQQNPYTFGYKPSSILSVGIANISTRVPTLQFKYPNQTTVQVSDLSANLANANNNTRQPIKMILAPSKRQFIEEQDTGEIAELTNSSAYLPRDSVTLQPIQLKSLNSATATIINNNRDPNTAVHIMVVFDKMTFSTETELKPYIVVYFDYSPNPSEQRHTRRMMLTEQLVSPTSDHRNYTFFLNPVDDMITAPNYYLNMTSYFEHHTLQVGVGVYYSSCQYFNTETEQWSSDGLSTSEESLPSVAVCYSDHLTSFGSFIISPPNIITDINITDINFAQNPVALILVVVIFAMYILVLIISYRLDQRDIRSASIIPLCGPNHAYKYEITVKTSAGLGSGTTANVGICVYGYEDRTGAKHLYKPGAFQRGSVDVFHIASECSLGTVYKLKVWHDNTGLDPGWSVSRIMVKDLQTNAKYYFLLDCWLQVYPDEIDETCLQKTIRAASDEEMFDFSMRFGTQLSYGWEDAHLWLSLLERPPRSSFTRVQRATCCVTLVYMFILFSAFWYQDIDDTQGEGLLQWRDAAVGAIVSVMVFPINLLIVFLFKKSECKVSPKMSWDNNRAQTAQTVEIIDEVLDVRSRKSTLSRMFGFDSHFPFTDQINGYRNLDLKTTTDGDTLDRASTSTFNKCASDDTGIVSDMSNSPTNETYKLRRRSTRLNVSPPDQYDYNEDDDFWDPFVSDGGFKDDEVLTTRPTNLRRTQKAKFSSNLVTTADDVEIDNEAYEEDSNDDENSVKSYVRRDLHSAGSTTIGPITESSEYTFHLPHLFMYLAYVLCFIGVFVSIFFIILYGHQFGVETAERWLISMAIAFLESFFLIEPIKVLFLAIYVAMFTKHHTPEQNDNIVEEPIVETYDHIMKPSKIRPPGGFALEQCKDQEKKSAQSRKYILHFAVSTIFLWAVVVFCFWDRDIYSYWSSWSVKNALYKSQFQNNGTDAINFYGIKTDGDIWAWMDNVFKPNVIDKLATFDDNSNNFNHLLGQVRIRQQRTLPESCSVNGYSSWFLIPTDHLCIPSSSFKQDKATYFPGWRTAAVGFATLWQHTPALLGFGYWGKNRIYDDSGYTFYLDNSTYTSQIEFLKEEGWLDRLTRVLFVEFTQLNAATHWFTVTTVMFEIDLTGVVSPFHLTQTIRLFTPSSAAYLDMFFIAIIGVIVIFLWAHEIIKLCRVKGTARDRWKHFNWLNTLIILLATSLCIMFVYKEIYMEEVMRGYKSNRTGFTNFYGIALISNATMYLAGMLLVVLMIKAVRVLRFFRCLYVFGLALSKGFKLILATTVVLIALTLTFAQIGFLIFGLNSAKVIPDFQDFQNSLYSMFRVFRGRLDTQACFNAFPVFSVVFFFSYFFGIFLVFCRLFSAILMKEYKDSRLTINHQKFHIPEYEIMNYMINRVKLHLGLIKPKQYRPTVHFEDMSTMSSESSFISLDSLGSCFTPDRMSQCSEVSDDYDSGRGTPSDHSLSLFDFLTLEHPPFKKPLDDLHLDYLFDRLSSYSVDMMLHRMERVNKLNDDVLSIESKLLNLTQKLKQKKIMQRQSSEIARAVTSTSMPDSKLASGSPEGNIGLRKTNSFKPRTNKSPTEASNKANSATRKPSPNEKVKHPPFRSSSYLDATRLPRKSASAYLPVATESENPLTKKRPHSDEGVRVSTSKTATSKLDSIIKKRTAW